MSKMKNREQHILDAATQVFLRYGVKRASMGDIAAEAGVARQTLYNSYANKDDILRGSIRAYGAAAIAAIEAGLPKLDNLGDQVDLVLEEMSLKPFIFLHSSPNAQDLIDGYNAAGRDEMEANYLAFQGVLTKIFAPYTPALSDRGLSPEMLAECLRRAAAAFKNQARDEAHLRELMQGLRIMAVEAAGSSGGKPSARTKVA